MRIIIRESQLNAHYQLDGLHLSGTEKQLLTNILENSVSYAYHGTNRDFNDFSYNEIRSWRSKSFLGDGVFLTPSKEIAAKYANANANKELSFDIIDRALKSDRQLGEFMGSLYHRGNSTWEFPKYKELLDNWPYDVDPNDVAELVNLIPNSRSLKDYNQDGEDRSIFHDFFSQHHNALEGYQIENLKKLGLGDYSPKIYTVKIMPTQSVLFSNNPNEIKKSKTEIIIAYGVDNLLEDKPEIIVKNIALLKILSKKNI